MYKTPQDASQRLGEGLSRLRLQKGLTQAEVARQANIAVTSLQRIERGTGGTIATLMRILTALDATAWLDGLAPEVSVSPLDLIRRRRSVRKRAYAPRPGRNRNNR